MKTALRAVRIGTVGLGCLAMAACSSIQTVNGVDVHTPREERLCGGFDPAVCLIVGGLVVGAIVLGVTARDSGTTTTTTTTTTSPTIVTTPTTTTTSPVAVSDARLKRDIKLARTLESGLRLYTFRYVGEEQTFVGVLAQDLLADERFRSAVHTSESGFYVVDYARLGVGIIGAAQMEQAGSRALRSAISSNQPS